MYDGPYIAEAAALIGDPARSNMLVALMAGRALSATELTYAAGVAPSTTSEHLKKLVGGGLLSVISSGRNRYFRLASPAVADALESLMALSAQGPPRHRPPTRCSAAMALGRTCFDHLAGRLGVAIADSLIERGLVVVDQDQASLTEPGRASSEISASVLMLTESRVRAVLCASPVSIGASGAGISAERSAPRSALVRLSSAGLSATKATVR